LPKELETGMTTIRETTDAPSDTSTPYAMSAGDQFFGTMSQNATDWIEVTLVAGRTYSFGAVGMGAAGSGVSDPLLKLHSANGTVLTQNDDGGPGLSSHITYQATVSGTFYIEAKSLAGSVDGAYGVTVSRGDLPSYGVEMGAAVLYRPGSSWAATPDTPVVLTWGVRASGPATDASGNVAPFHVLTAAQIATAQAALGNFSDVATVTFQQVSPGGTTNNATILIGAYTSTTDGAGAYASFPGSTAASDGAGDLWINTDSVSGTSLPVGSYDYYVFMHELGHAMGLAHPGDYNAAPGVTITYANAAQFVQDSQQYSVMSYFDATATERDMPNSYADTLMMYDIYAVQQMYGVNHAARAGNDTYGFNATLGGAYDFVVNPDPLMCIWDGAGIDTLDLSGFFGKQVIDLNDGAFSDVGGYKGNLSIAVGAVIENAVGGRGGDILYGNEVANTLRGGNGLDLLAGAGGNDRLTGGRGADGFVFGSGDGHDRVADFTTVDDVIRLSADLWGGAVLTAAQVVAQFAVIRHGDVVLDFGADGLTLLHVTTTVGLAGDIVIS
jgi:serralysin